MKKLFSDILITSSLIAAGSLVTACNSGSSSGSDSSTALVQFLPDGSAQLADGTQVKLSSQIINMDENHLASAVVSVKGPTSLASLKLKAVPLNNGLTTQLSSQSPNVDRLQLQSSAISGSNQVQLVATGLSGSPVVGIANVNVSAGSMIKASYVDISASGSLAQISPSGYKAANVVIFGFADTTTSSINSSYLSAMQTAMNSESTGTVNLLSIGGGTGDATTMSDPATVVSNIYAQITEYNSKLTNGKIDGVDLDLEGEFTATQITNLASGFKAKGLVVSVAPQIYLSSGTSVDSSNPANLVLTSGSPYSTQSNYTPAIAGGYVDYIFVQTYNTPGWTIDGYAESQVEFFKAAAKALNNSTKSDCSAYASSTTSLCIPDGDNLVIGTVANAGAAYNTANIFNATIGSSYNQSSILSQLKTSIDEMIADPVNYPYFDGVMMWSLNTDYAPSLYSDTSATTGAFSTTIYGAESSGGSDGSGPYFILQISNTGNGSGSYPYATASLKINGLNYEFGGLSSAGKDTALKAGANKSWGTLASAQDSNTSSYVTDSANLDALFASGTTSFTVSGIQINKYSDENKTSAQYVTCNSILSYTTLEAGHSYNVMVNPTYNSCAIEKIN